MKNDNNTMRRFINITEDKETEFYHDIKVDGIESSDVNTKSLIKPYTKLNDSPKMGLKESEDIKDIKSFLIKHQTNVLESAKIESTVAKTNSLKNFWEKSILSLKESIRTISKNNNLKELRLAYDSLPKKDQILETKIYEHAEQTKNGSWYLRSSKTRFNECDSLQGYVSKLSNDKKQTITLIMKESSGKETKETFSPLIKG